MKFKLKVKELRTIEDEAFDRIWFDRVDLNQNIPDDIRRAATENYQKIKEKYKINEEEIDEGIKLNKSISI